MSPDAQRVRKLLYVGDYYSFDVYVYDYETGSAVGKLTRFVDPRGQCVDARGDVWITQGGRSGGGSGAGSAVEYAHGGSAPIKTLAAYGNTIGCAVAPNGDLAVANLDVRTSSGFEPGYVLIFKDASGTPERRTCSGAPPYYYPPGYDDQGNLYVEVAGSSSQVAVCELPAGRRSLTLTTVNATLDYGDSVMWDGKYITLSDRSYDEGAATGIYRAERTSSGGLNVVGSTVLTNSCTPDDVFQPFIVGSANTPENEKQGRTVVGGFIWCDNVLDYWQYPSGGTPSNQIVSAPEEPQGQSVSIRLTPSPSPAN